MNVLKKIREFWSEEDGQSTTEYILILGVVVIIAMKFKKGIGDKITGATEKIGGRIDTVLNETE
jgi:Flp pilus assembly pilin Flp